MLLMKKPSLLIIVFLFSLIGQTTHAQPTDPKFVAAVSKIREITEILVSENHPAINRDSAEHACAAAIDPTTENSVSTKSNGEAKLISALKKIEPGKIDKAVDDCLNSMAALSGPNTEIKPIPAVGTTASDFGGIGVETQEHSDGLLVISVVSKAPAEAMGLKPNDIITSVNGVRLVGMPLQAAVQLFKGAPRTAISVSVRRPGLENPVTLQGKREVIQIETVLFRDYQNTLYVRYRTFSGKSLRELAEALNTRRKEKVLFKQMIVDLRFCTGGDYYTMIELLTFHLDAQATLFKVQKKEQIETVTTNNAPFNHTSSALVSSGQYPTDWPDQLRKIPIVVLVNKMTASGAEVFASALKDNNRAKLIGESTAGITNLDTIKYVDQSKSYIRLTTGHMLRANGEKIHNVGITPDIIMASQGITISDINVINSIDPWLESALVEVAR
jgi:carboxyl-terminal processing protease